MKILPTEKQSSLGLKIKYQLEQRLEELRVQNDGDLDQVRTAKLRGRIREVKNMLNELEDKPAFEIESDDSE